MTDFSTSSTSQSDSKTKQPFHFRAKIEVQNIQVIANLRNLHQHTIKLSIKNLKRKQSNNTQDLLVTDFWGTQPKKKKVVVEDSPPEEDQYFDGERYEISSEELDELLRKNVDKSAAEGENEPDLRSTEGRYASSETIPAVNLGSDDPSSQGRTEQSSVNHPSESMLSPVQQSASELADLNMMVVREQTPSDALVIVPIQVFVPASQTTTMPELQETPESDFEPTPLLQIEGTTETTPEPPQQLQETTPTLPQLHLKFIQPQKTLLP
ncbi:uncharacterized protein [Arachis hypogaea]|uniref:uncharacterized protein n=1 Tax=Arachis hypogaea TaxID=3818 RepID=UPI003B227A4F